MPPAPAKRFTDADEDALSTLSLREEARRQKLGSAPPAEVTPVVGMIIENPLADIYDSTPSFRRRRQDSTASFLNRVSAEYSQANQQKNDAEILEYSGPPPPVPPLPLNPSSLGEAVVPVVFMRDASFTSTYEPLSPYDSAPSSAYGAIGLGGPDWSYPSTPAPSPSRVSLSRVPNMHHNSNVSSRHDLDMDLKGEYVPAMPYVNLNDDERLAQETEESLHLLNQLCSNLVSSINSGSAV